MKILRGIMQNRYPIIRTKTVDTQPTINNESDMLDDISEMLEKI